MRRHATVTSAAGASSSTRWTHSSLDKGRQIMQAHKIVSRQEWTEARKVLMAREKELTRAREVLSEDRRNMPWVKVDKAYVFDGPHGKVALGDLFKGRPQLVVQHV